MTEPVTWRRDGSLGRIELNRPAAANALDPATASALGDAVEEAAAQDVHTVLVTGAGTRFCAGGDVQYFARVEDQPAALSALASKLDEVFQRLARLEKPVVVGVQGAVAGAGLALMLSGDIVVAGGTTKFVTGYAGIGLNPDCGLSWLLPRAVGHQRASEMLLAGRLLTAPEALQWGLVTRVVDVDQVEEEALALAQSLAAGPSFALGQTRRLLRESWESARGETGVDEARTIARAVGLPIAREAISQFVSKGG